MKINKKINLNLEGLNGNAFNLMGHFRKQAEREDWTEEEIKFVLEEAMRDDYDYLVYFLQKYCE